MFRHVVTLTLLVVGGLVGSSPVAGQISTGTIVGTVTDSTGAVMPKTQVELRHVSTNETFRAVTNDAGDYVVSSLPIGAYDARATLTGFKADLKTGVQLPVGRTVRVDFSLEVGEVAETVSVTVDAPLLNTDKAEQGLSVDNRKIAELPLSARDFQALVTLAPGVMPSRGQIHGGGLDAGGLYVQGQRRQDNVIYLDGSIVSGNNGTMAFNPSIDALAEFQVKTGQYGADYGIRPGGQVIAVTKSGTNEPHGTVFGFHQNEKLSARNFFSQQKTDFKRTYYGANLGGPISIPGIVKGKDKLWFFVNYEQEIVRRFLPLTGIVPTAAQKQGQFSVPIVDPLTGNPFPNQTIPASRISPVSREFLGFYPEPNTSGALNFTSPNTTANFDNPQFIAKVDYRATENDRISGRFLYASRPTLSSHAIAEFSATFPLANWGGEITHSKTIGNRFINVAGLHVYRFYRSTSATNPEHREFTPRLGIPELLETDVGRNGVPGIGVTGFIGMGDPLLLTIPLGNWQVKDDLSFAHGSHFFKVGGEYRRAYNFFLLSLRPSFSFDGRYSGHPFADFLLGYPSSAIEGGELQRGNLGQNNFYFYAQDDWKVGSKLTLNLGLRHEQRRPWRDKRGFSSNFNPFVNQFNPPLQSTQVQPPATGRYVAGEPLVEFNNPLVLPRTGFAYRMNDRTVFRGGYGAYANEIDLSNLGGMMENPRPNAELKIFLGDARVPNLAFPDPFLRDSLLDLGTPDLAGSQSPLDVPVTHAWGVSVQRQFGRTMAVEAGYQGSRSVHLIEAVSVNDATPGTGPRQARRPFPAYQRIDFNMSDGDSWHKGLNLRVERRVSGPGLYLLGSFTWARTVDTAGSRLSGNTFEQGLRSRNMPLDRHKALSESHVGRRLSITAGYDLPFGADRPFLESGVGATVLGGWRVQGIASLQDGPWLTVLLPGDRLDTGTSFSQWPDRIADPNMDPSNRTPQRWFDTSAFAVPTELRYGNAGRSTVEGPGIINVDLAVHRTFKVGSQHSFEFRFEAFNALNRANFFPPGLAYGTGAFGVIGRAFDGRQLQLGLKYRF